MSKADTPDPREAMLVASEAVKAEDYERAEDALLQSLSDLRKAKKEAEQ